MLSPSRFLRASPRGGGVLARSLLVSLCGFHLSQGEALLLEKSFSGALPSLSIFESPFLLADAQSDVPLRVAAPDEKTLTDQENNTSSDEEEHLLSPLALGRFRRSSKSSIYLRDRPDESEEYGWIYSSSPGQDSRLPPRAGDRQTVNSVHMYTKQKEDRQDGSSNTGFLSAQTFLTSSEQESNIDAEPKELDLPEGSHESDSLVVEGEKAQTARPGERRSHRRSLKRRMKTAYQKMSQWRSKRFGRRNREFDIVVALLGTALVGMAALVGHQAAELHRLKQREDTLESLVATADELAKRLRDGTLPWTASEVDQLSEGLMRQRQAFVEGQKELASLNTHQRQMEEQMLALKALVEQLIDEQPLHRNEIRADMKNVFLTNSKEFQERMGALLFEASKVIDDLCSAADSQGQQLAADAKNAANHSEAAMRAVERLESEMQAAAKSRETTSSEKIAWNRVVEQLQELKGDMSAVKELLPLQQPQPGKHTSVSRATQASNTHATAKPKEPLVMVTPGT
ncbi:conserved hypothetical protein [Neospora caninum Liverpool]|uniref:Uncharacterized protein n=1 Tax=Neospora caninum (strain Liverpool) TaxID=572307 RepID=F0VEZ4_NEOCL|nr:conserved hypothetical protein [Neospora caninum Liverpool]CBZ52288.1 conserved hypothetical protein [Neospora caninum Liverpool]CEL66256.1 TPA: hypothetical protein BN1204_020750 [Neospora caninum Liverpool]|eukprot:XP_003882320.1 conserved hypothetical protein [Neospora caninum Liverpool]